MWISRRIRGRKPLVAHRDNGGPATGVGFAGGLGLRLQECNLLRVENGPSHEGSPFDCRCGWSFKGGVEIEAAV